MSSDGLLYTTTSSNTPPSNILPNAFHSSYAYPQGIPLKETQANIPFAANIFHTAEAKYSQPSYNTMLAMPTSATSHSPLSLDVAPC